MVDKMITNASNKSSFGNNKSSSSPGFPDSSICRYWALGTCVLNQRCRFKHIGPPGIPPASSARRNHRMIVTTTASGRVVVTTDRSSSTGSSVVYRQVTSPPPLPQYSTKTSSPSSPRSVSSFNVGLASTEGVVMNNLDEVRVKQRDNDLLTPQSVDYKTSTTTTDQSSTLNYHHHLLDNRDYNNNVNSVAIINDKNNNNTNSSVDIGVGIATCKVNSIENLMRCI